MAPPVPAGFGRRDRCRHGHRRAAFQQNLRFGGFKGGITVIDAVASIATLASPPDLAGCSPRAADAGHAAPCTGSQRTFAAVVLCPADALTEAVAPKPGVRMLSPDSFGIVVAGIDA